ncbi:IclR family transcriptional regulator [Cupriavidus sp. 2KB_3]|uniref:IclR family transcriptional regulator n=1 Tax=Cupriavidus TaxID=106589 RepID=UPI0011EC6BD8|nr:IclR family transcriptional regulator [Cupriavidus campinensis]
MAKAETDAGEDVGTAPKGAQTVTRAMVLLKLIAAHHPAGVALGVLAQAAGLDRATAYRLAMSLADSGMVEREQRLYRLGLDAMQLGLAAMKGAPILDRCRPVMQRLARRTEDTVFLVVRNGDYGHCLHCEEGAFPVKALVLQVGGMRVLGIGSAGMTLLSMLDDGEIAALYARHTSEFTPHGLSLAKLRTLVTRARSAGLAKTDSLVNEGVSGVGMHFEITPGNFAAVSVAAIRSRMQESRKQWIADLIAEELRSAGFRCAYAGAGQDGAPGADPA